MALHEREPARFDEIAIRPLRSDDLETVDRVAGAAYGIGQSYVWRLRAYLDEPAVASFIAVERDVPVGCVFGLDYGCAAYVALMAVDPKAQGRGIGSALMAALISWSQDRSIPSLLLDATPAGAPLYERAGFVDDGETVVFKGEAVPRELSPSVRRATTADHDAIFAMDRLAFGADRRTILDQLFDTPGNAVFVGDDGSYAVAQANSVGPVIARGGTSAAALLDAALAARAGTTVNVSVPTNNTGAIPLVTERGFIENRRLRHMRRGPRVDDNAAMLWARINLGQG